MVCTAGVVQLVANITAAKPPTAVCSWANNFKAYQYYCALHIDDVRLALSDINEINIYST
jgi:hypothetical protein